MAVYAYLQVLRRKPCDRPEYLNLSVLAPVLLTDPFTADTVMVELPQTFRIKFPSNAHNFPSWSHQNDSVNLSSLFNYHAFCYFGSRYCAFQHYRSCITNVRLLFLALGGPVSNHFFSDLTVEALIR